MNKAVWLVVGMLVVASTLFAQYDARGMQLRNEHRDPITVAVNRVAAQAQVEQENKLNVLAQQVKASGALETVSYYYEKVLAGKGFYNSFLGNYSKNGHLQAWHYREGDSVYILLNAADAQDIRKEIPTGTKFYADHAFRRIGQQHIQVGKYKYTFSPSSRVFPGKKCQLDGESYELLTFHIK